MAVGYAHDFTGFGTDQATRAQQEKQGFQGTYRQMNRSPSDAQYNYGAAANEALQSGFSGQGQATTDFQDQLRSAAQSRLNDFGANADQYRGQQANWLDTQLQRGFNTQASAMRRNAAGTGMAGSMGQQRAQNNMVQSNNEARQKALEGLQQQFYNQQGQEIQNAGGINQGLFNQQLQERGFQNQQAQSLADLYQNLQKTAYGAQQGAQARADAETNAKRAMWSTLISGSATVGGAALGGPAGAAAGSQMGGMLMPQKSSYDGSGLTMPTGFGS